MQSLSLVNRINWEEKYTDLKPSWYENPKVLKVARERIAEVAATLAIGATFVYFCKVATPMVIMGTFWGVGIGLTACAVAAFAVSYLLAHPNPWACPEYKREQAQKIAQEITEQKLSYLEIQKRYDNLPTKQALFTNSEWNLLVFEREAASANSYDTFIQRNGLDSLKMLEKSATHQVKALFFKKVEEQVNLLFNGTLSYAQFISNNASNSYFQQALETLSPTKKEFFSVVNNLERQASHKREEAQQETTRRLNHYAYEYERDKARFTSRLDSYQRLLNPLEQAVSQAEQELLRKKNLLSSQVAEQESYRNAEANKARLTEEIRQKEAALALFDQQGRESLIAQKRAEVEKIKNTAVQGVPAARAAIAQMDVFKREIKVLEKELAAHAQANNALNNSRTRLAGITEKATKSQRRLGELKGIIEHTRFDVIHAQRQRDVVKRQLEETKWRFAPEVRLLEQELQFVQDQYTQDCQRVRERLQQELSCIARRLTDEQEEALLAYRNKTY